MLGAVSLTKNKDIDQYKYSGYGIGLDRKGTFSVSNRFAKNCIIFGADMSYSVHIDNKKEDILILGEEPTHELDGITLTPEKSYSINFTKTIKFCLSLHYDGGNSYLFVNGTEIIKFKAKDSEIVATPSCLGKDFSVDNMKKTRLNAYVYGFNVDYDVITRHLLFSFNNISEYFDSFVRLTQNLKLYNYMRLPNKNCQGTKEKSMKILSNGPIYS